MDLAQVFLAPQNTTHRQYEALRAYFVEQLPGPEVARRFGYTPGSLQQLVHQFRQRPDRSFFVEPTRPGVKADEAVRKQIVQLRQQNLSVDDISEALKKAGAARTAVTVSQVLRQEGLSAGRRASSSCLAEPTMSDRRGPSPPPLIPPTLVP
jgi:hypothetical protein